MRTPLIVARLGMKSVLFTLLLLPATFTQAQTRGAYRDVQGMPAGPIGDHLKALLDAIGSHDAAKTRSLVQERFAPGFRDLSGEGAHEAPADPIGVHVGEFAQAYDQSHGFDLYGIRQYDDGGRPHETVAIVKNRLTGGWGAIVFTTEPAPPHRIAGLYFSSARPPSGLPPLSRLTVEEVVTALKDHLQRVGGAGAFSGTVLLAKDGEVLLRSAHGLASKRFEAPNRIDTKFNLGSMNKMFTSVAIAQLAEQGKLSFSDPLSKYLSEDWLPQVDKSKIRLEHLLTHTSGLGSYFNDVYMKSSRQMFREVDDYKVLVEGDTLAFEPGTRWQYSNTGMLILGAVIESASGQNYFEYIREHIYKPAGMVNSDSYDMDRPVVNLVTAEFSPDGDSVLTGSHYGTAQVWPVRVEDLLRLAEARCHRELTEDEREEYHDLLRN